MEKLSLTSNQAKLIEQLKIDFKGMTHVDLLKLLKDGYVIEDALQYGEWAKFERVGTTPAVGMVDGVTDKGVVISFIDEDGELKRISGKAERASRDEINSVISTLREKQLKKETLSSTRERIRRCLKEEDK